MARTEGGTGFSILELLVMENGIAGPLNPRHPFRAAEFKEAADRKTLLRDRAAYYRAQAEAQAEAQAADDQPTPLEAQEGGA